MNIFRKILFSFLILSLSSISVFADTSAGIYGEWNTLTKDDLRNGNITMTDVPVMIASMIEYILALVGSICVVALIYHAVCMQFASGITGDSTWVDKAKKWMKWAILGFALSMSAWFLMTKLVALLSTL